MNRTPIISDKPTGRLGSLALAALAAPSIGLAALALPLVVYLPSYYSGALGLRMSVVGGVFMLVRLADIGLDPLIGGWMDRTRTRFGRFKPWLAIGAPMVMIGMIMLFTAKPGVGPLYLALGLVIAYAGWSTVSLAQLSLAANASPDYNERSRIYGWWQNAFMIGLIAVVLAPKAMQLLGHSGQAASMTAMAWLVVVIMPLLAGFTLIGVRERPVITTSNKGDLRDYFRLMVRRDVRIVLAAELLLGLGAGTTTTLALFFFSLTKGVAPADIGLILIGQWVVAMLVTPLWARVAARLGKHRALAAAAVLSAAVQMLLLAIPSGDLVAAILIFSLVGLSYGAIAQLPRAMLADCADAERLDGGADRTGLLFALLTGVWKIGQAVSVGALFTGLEMIGFSASAGQANAPATLLRLQLLYCLLPTALSLIAAVVVLRYPLTIDRHKDIRAALALQDGAI